MAVRCATYGLVPSRKKIDCRVNDNATFTCTLSLAVHIKHHHMKLVYVEATVPGWQAH